MLASWKSKNVIRVGSAKTNRKALAYRKTSTDILLGRSPNIKFRVKVDTCPFTTSSLGIREILAYSERPTVFESFLREWSISAMPIVLKRDRTGGPD